MRKVTFFILFLFLISFVSPLNYKEKNRQIENEIYFETFFDENLTEKGYFELIPSKEGFIFLKKIKFNENYNNAEIELIMDYGYFLSDLGASPSNYEFVTDGQLIKIKWNFINVSKGEEKTFFAIIEKPKEKTKFFIYFFYGIFFILILLIYYFLFRRNKKEKERFLLDEEKKIINYLKKCDRNEAWQKNIQKDLEFSKAKLSRLIRNLESRGLIKKIPFGNTNKILLN